MDKMNNDRQIFRTPYFTDDGRFAGFEYRRFVNGRVEWVKDEWEPWVSKQDKLTPCSDEQCTGLKDKNGNLIYEGDVGIRNDAFVKNQQFTVLWDDKDARFMAKTDKGILGFLPHGEYDEIIGNMHEQKGGE